MALNLFLKPLSCVDWPLIRKLGSSSQVFSKRMLGKPKLSEKKLAKKFADEKRVILVAGKGGDGRSGFLRDKHTAFGGPNGGNGGRGGDIVFVANHNTKGLEQIQSQYFAPDGKDGGCLDMFGKNGESLEIAVPVGTLVRCDVTNEIIADFSKDGQSCLMCAGGQGGKGNRFFVSSVNTTPEECTPGLPGEKLVVWIELRTLAHAGLVGFPNAGKSTMLQTLTKARPAVAAYPFTTLVPHVGVLHFDDFTQITIADTPGIIEGAHLNRGLGIRFLKHVERCRFLLYVVDMSVSHPSNQLDEILYELEQYDVSLMERPGIVLANKIDLAESVDNFHEFKEHVDSLDKSLNVLPVSGKKGTFLEDLICKIREFYDEDIKERKRYGKTIALEW